MLSIDLRGGKKKIMHSPVFIIVGDFPIENGVVGFPVGADALSSLRQIHVVVSRYQEEVERLRSISGRDHRRTTEIVHDVTVGKKERNYCIQSRNEIGKGCCPDG